MIAGILRTAGVYVALCVFWALLGGVVMLLGYLPWWLLIGVFAGWLLAGCYGRRARAWWAWRRQVHRIPLNDLRDVTDRRTLL